MKTKAPSLWLILTAMFIPDKRLSAAMLTKVIGRPPVASGPSCLSTLIRLPEAALGQSPSKLMWTERIPTDSSCSNKELISCDETMEAYDVLT